MAPSAAPRSRGSALLLTSPDVGSSLSLHAVILPPSPFPFPSSSSLLLSLLQPSSAQSLFSSSPSFSLPPASPDPDAAFLMSEAVHPPDPVGRIPRIIHYVYGLREGKQVTFELDDYISVKAAVDVLGAERVLFWVRNIPTGEWWEAMLALGKKRAAQLGLPTSSVIELKTVRDVSTVFGRRVESSAHKADVIRMEALLTYGGIYMDMDVIALRSMDQLIDEGWGCILGQEQTATGTHPHGLGNAYMLAHRASPFFYQWYTAYTRFDHHQWAALSIHLPIRLSRALPELCHELGPYAFYYPSFDEEGKRLMYLSNDYDLSRNYGVHLWSGGKKHRNQKSIEELCQVNSTWGRIARTALLAGEGNSQICNGRGID